MTDIVQRLRTLHRHEAAELAMLDAATEIEGLRNDLATERERCAALCDDMATQTTAPQRRCCAQDLARQIRRATTTGGAYSCAKRGADPTNAAATCTQWCGDTTTCLRAPVPCATVIAAILAVDSEAARRGEMFPQTADEQREDRKAMGRVVAMLMWYEKNTGCARLTGWPGSQE